MDQLVRALEAILFLGDEPMSAERLSELTGETPEDVEAALDRLGEQLEASERGIQLRKLTKGYRMYTHPAVVGYVEKFLAAIDRRRLTQAALETLAIAAYKQPVTRAEVSRIRGVNAEAAMSSLTEKGYLKEVGRDDTPGQPFLYGTTPYFLEQMGMLEIAELPPLESFEPDDQTKEQIVLSFTKALE